VGYTVVVRGIDCRCLTLAVVLGLVAVGCAETRSGAPAPAPTAAGGSTAEVERDASSAGFDWRAEEARYRRQYPRVMQVAARRVPYRQRMLRLMYFSGAVGAYYHRPPRANARMCAGMRDPNQWPLMRIALREQLLSTPADADLIGREGVTEAQVLNAYRRGGLLGCSLPR
jgi:hypothetical protein